MDNNDTSKPQQTGGLKLMTVFIAVLALHVIVIGGFTVYHLMSGGTEADLVSLDKTHKDKTGDVATTTPAPDASQPDKTASGPAPTTDAAATTAPANPPAVTPATTTPPSTLATSTVPAPSADDSVASETPAPAPAPAPVPAQATVPTPVPAPALALAPPPALTLAPSNAYAQNPSLSSLAPPPDAPDNATAPAPLTPSAPAPLAGPVHMPPAAAAPTGTHVEHAERAEHGNGEIYTVKITDSYKKIAKSHHITVAELKDANHIHDNVLHTGQKLIIPAVKTSLAKSEKSEKPEPTTLAATPGTSMLSQAPAMRTAVLTSTTTTEVSSHERDHVHTYTVAKGDTLTKIAHKFKTTPSAIMAENNITDPARLTIGKKLRIPSRESRSASIAAPVTAPAEPSEVKNEAPQPVETIRPTPPVEQSSQETQPAGDLATFTP